MLGAWRSELGASRRLRLALFAVAFVVVLLAVDAFGSASKTARVEVRQLAREAVRLDHAPPAELWQQRAAEAAAWLAQQQDRVWVVKSPGEAQAALHERLTSLLAKEGAERINVTVADPEPLPAGGGGLLRVKCSASFEIDRDKAWSAFGRIETEQPELIVESITARTRPRLRLELALLSIARLVTPEANTAVGGERAGAPPSAAEVQRR
jgi:hypothetical protein